MAHRHAPGLVLHMYPEELLKHGAAFTGEADNAVTAQHYFVCVAAGPKEGLWVPLFQGPGADRKMISETAKSGHSRWTRGPSFYDTAQLWRISHTAVQRGAAAAMDQSQAKAPNSVALTALPSRDLFPPDSEFNT